MSHTEILNLLGPQWQKLKIFNSCDTPYLLACRTAPLLDYANSNSAYIGNKHNPKIAYPLIRKRYVVEANRLRRVYVVTMQAIIQIIVNSRKPICQYYRGLLKNNGYLK